jgi:hypothetical protein
MQIKKGIVFTLVFILLLNLVLSQTVVEVKDNTKPVATVWYKSTLFWGIMVTILLVIAIIIVLAIVIGKIVKYIKLRKDLFYKLRTDRLKLAKTQATYPSNHWWRTDKNTPIRLVRNDANNKPRISEPIAYHRGDYYSHEGNLIIAMNVKGKKKWLLFPTRDILIIPNKDKRYIKGTDEKGKQIDINVENIPTAKDIVQFQEKDILIYAEAISQSGDFYIPVLKTENGKIMNLALPVYQSLKDVVVEDYLYSQTSSFVDIAKKAVDMNVELRARTRLNDANSSVDIPSSYKNNSQYQ